MERRRGAAARVERRLPLGAQAWFRLLPVLLVLLVLLVGLGVVGQRAGLSAMVGSALLLLAGCAPLSLVVHRRSQRLAELGRRLEALQDSQQTVRAILDTASDAFIGMDTDGYVDEWNEAAERVFGWTRAEALGQPLSRLIVPLALRGAHEDGIKAYQRRGHGPMIGRTVEMSAIRRDGSELPVELVIWESRWGGARRFNAFIRDITERKRLVGELTHRALYDSLTGLANRTLFSDRLEHALARRPSADHHVVVLYLDLDDFKTVNDSLGHSVGDHLLVAVATRLAGATRTGDTLARLAGDEFALLAEDVAGLDEAEQIADRLIESLRAPFPLAGRETYVRASIGIALRDGNSDAEGLLRNADIAMYAAKRSPSSGFAIFEPEMHAAAVERLELKADLQRAIGRDELRVHYQPVVELMSGEVIGFEALVRWEHPRRGLLQPSAFVPLAEETGLIRAIDRWVLAQACRQAADWQAEGTAGPLTISVNVSARDLADPSLIDDVRTALSATGLPPAALVLEVTESALAESLEVAAERLGQLRELGVRIALDDFGTGYSSLAALARFPIDTFKIDKSFVDSLVTDPDSPMAQAIVEIGRTLALQTVAEGVESVAQLVRLRTLGCQLAQGFLFARPLPAGDAGSLLGRRLDSRSDRPSGPEGHLALPV